MLSWLVPLFFFAVLLGSPVPGFLVFTALGLVQIWQNRRQTAQHNAFVWTREDSWLALCFLSIPLFKALTALWSPTPSLAFQNAFWHLYFVFWPLVLLGLYRCKSSQENVEIAISLGLIVVAAWRSAFALTNWEVLHPGHANLGILAQLTMTIGAWNMLALTRPDSFASHRRRGLHAAGLVATIVILVLSTRRLELLGFGAIMAIVIFYRLRQWITPIRAALLLMASMAFVVLLVYLRWEKFALGFEQIAQYQLHGANTPDFTANSWGIRLELWRVSWAAFLDHPWLGISASARPFNMQTWGAPPAELFMHRHFHSHLMQTLVEGGLLGLLVLSTALFCSIRLMITVPWKFKRESSLLAAALLLAYVLEGTVSATLHYDKANALLVVTSCWIWLQLRQTAPQERSQSGVLKRTIIK